MTRIRCHLVFSLILIGSLIPTDLADLHGSFIFCSGHRRNAHSLDSQQHIFAGGRAQRDDFPGRETEQTVPTEEGTRDRGLRVIFLITNNVSSP